MTYLKGRRVMNNKYFASVAATVVILSLFTACGKKTDSTEQNSPPSTSVPSTSASASKSTTLVTTSIIEEEQISPDYKDFNDEEFAEFVNKQGLDKSLTPLMERAINICGGLNGLGAYEYPGYFEKGSDGEYWGVVMSDNKLYNLNTIAL